LPATYVVVLDHAATPAHAPAPLPLVGVAVALLLVVFGVVEVLAILVEVGEAFEALLLLLLLLVAGDDVPPHALTFNAVLVDNFTDKYDKIFTGAPITVGVVGWRGLAPPFRLPDVPVKRTSQSE
jgi:hypothetical protein